MIHRYSKNRIKFSAKALFVASFIGAAGLSAGSAWAQPSELVLYSFCQLTNCADGLNPYYGGLIATSQGGLYGTTQFGGSANVGVAFLVSVNGGFGILHQFQGGAMDGAVPLAPPFMDKSGNFYGTTSEGGASGFGTIFERSAAGTYRLRHAFNGADGAEPAAGVVADSAGNLYGTTRIGGAANSGKIFKLSPSGILTTFYTFCSMTGCTDGENPYAGPIGDAKGNLYGTTTYGGANGFGVVFKIHGDGTTVLYSFKGPPGDGTSPFPSLAMDASGNLYGTTIFGGANYDGTVFKLAPDGSGYAVLYNFCSHSVSGCPDASQPVGRVILDAAGNLYGTTQYGGAFGSGAVFSLTPSGTYTVLYSFCSVELAVPTEPFP